MKESEQPKQLTPVYISVPQLQRLFDLASTRKLDQISMATFKAYGFNDSDAALVVSTLKFLGLADENNKPTELMDKLRLKGDMRTTEIEKIVRAAYSKLFDAVDEPYILSSDELINEFNVRYSSVKSDRVARAATSAFLKLCEYAGLVEAGTVTVQARTRTTEKKQARVNKTKDAAVVNKTTRSQSELDDSDSFTLPFPGGIALVMPKEMHNNSFLDDNLSDDLRKAVRVLNEFAKKYAKPDEAKGEAESE